MVRRSTSTRWRTRTSVLGGSHRRTARSMRTGHAVAGDNLPEGSRLVGVPRDRLGVGRHPDRLGGLPALVERKVIALAQAVAQAATRYGYGSTAGPSHGRHSK